MSRKRSLEALRRELRLCTTERSRQSLPFGVAAIDRALPNGGLDLAGLHEIIGSSASAGASAAATLFAAGILARISGPVVWCCGRNDLFAPALHGIGLDPGRIVWVEAGEDRRILACVEDSLRHGGAAAVVGEVRQLSLIASRRLQLAAAESGSLCLIVGRTRRGAANALPPSAAQTRWRITPLPSPPATDRGMPRGRWRIELLRCRGGEVANFIMEAPDATGHLALPADLVDRPLAAEPRQQCATG